MGFLKVASNTNESVKAIGFFTDREDPQEAFERKIRAFSKEWKESSCVMCYYGIGGIGKTSFINKLSRVIRGLEGNECRLLDKIDCDYIIYDFNAKDSGIDKFSILLKWRRQLARINPDFKFYRFDSAVLLYSKKAGLDIGKDEEVQSLLGDSPWLNIILDTAGMVPLLGIVPDAIKLFDQYAGAIKNAISNHINKEQYKNHLNRINLMEASEILDTLHVYFSLDMKNNMQTVAKRPLVIFLDTYEKFTDALNKKQSQIEVDFWLRRNCDSVIKSIPGIVWVITGREKLYWVEDDPMWDSGIPERPLDQMTEAEKEELACSPLEQHLLGDLSIKDSTYFLREKAGIYDEELCNQLYELTKGTPLFLDICVEKYKDLTSRGKNPEIEDFGNDVNQLISRYMSNMDSNIREMAYFFACIGTWTDESYKPILDKVTYLKKFSFTEYKMFMSKSFIIKEDTQSYYMHGTVRTAILKDIEREIFEEVSDIRLDLLKEQLETEGMKKVFLLLNNYTEILLEAGYNYEKFSIYLRDLLDKFVDLLDRGYYELIHVYIMKLYLLANKNYLNTHSEMLLKKFYGLTLSEKGKYEEAQKVIREVAAWCSKVYGEKDSSTLIAKSNLASVYANQGKYNEAQKLHEEVLKQRRKILGEDHLDTLHSKNNLASMYAEQGKYKESKKLHEEVVEQMCKVLGEDHPDTLTSKSNLASVYKEQGKYNEAQKLHEEVLKQRCRRLGEDHPDTLNSKNNLASVYEEQGKYNEAQKLHAEVLEQMCIILGEDHVNTLASKNNLASVCAKQEKYDEAQKLHEEVLEQRRKVLGEDHPDTLTSKNNIVYIFIAQGKYEEAQKLSEEVLEQRSKILGDNHIRTIEIKQNLAYVYFKQKKSNAAQKLYEEILDQRKRIMSENHPHLLRSKFNLATVYFTQGKYAEAQKLFEEVLQYKTSTLGEEHSETVLYKQYVEKCRKMIESIM